MKWHHLLYLNDIKSLLNVIFQPYSELLVSHAADYTFEFAWIRDDDKRKAFFHNQTAADTISFNTTTT